MKPRVWRYANVYETEKLLLKRVYSQLLDKTGTSLILTVRLVFFMVYFVWLGFVFFLTNELSVMYRI